MYFQGSRAGPNVKSRLMTPTYPGSSTRCAKFWYNMYGANMGTLNVYAKSGRSLGAAIWSLSGDQNQGWQLAQATIPSGQDYKVSAI